MKKFRKSNFGDNGFEAWGGYMAAKKAKLLDQFTNETSKKERSENSSVCPIFRGVSIHVNGFTDPPADLLKRMMMLYGGEFHHYYTCDKTKFIIASNLADAKVKQLRGQPKVVKPSWITESIAAQKLLDYRPFLLYSNQSKSQPKIAFPNLKIQFGGPSMSEDSNSSFNQLNVLPNMNDSNINAESSKVSTSNTEFSEEAVTDINCSKEMNSDLEFPLSLSIPSPERSPEEENLEAGMKISTSKEVGQYALPDETPIPQSTLTTAESSTKFAAQKIPKAGEPNFISEFYTHSRLHHISTMGSMFKKYISDLRKQHNGKFPGKDELIIWKQQNCSSESSVIAGNEKIIMHIDMDCFFVSVGVRDRPDLRGLPVAVTHAKGNAPASRAGDSRAAEIECYRRKMENKLSKHSTEESPVQLKDWMTREVLNEPSSMSEIASCNYEARAMGLKNGMFLGSALKRCPNLRTIPYDFEGYKEVSFILYNTVASCTLDIEAVSCDEMFVDCTALLRETNVSPMDFAKFLRSKIKEQTRCPASTGFGGNILLARLATKKAKPDGQFHLLPTDVVSFMNDIKVEDLPGVGRNLAVRLHSKGIASCEDLQRLSQSQLQAEFGQKIGQALYRHCRGQDDRSLDLEHQRKSVSAEINYGIRFERQEQAAAFIKELAVEVQSRLREITSSGRCITLKVMVKAKDAPTQTAKFMGHGVCDSLSRSSTLATATSDATIIAREAVSLLAQLNVPPSSLRGMGIQVSKLLQRDTKERSLHQFMTRSKKEPGALPAPCPSSVSPDPQPVGSLQEECGTSGEAGTRDGSGAGGQQQALDPEFLAALPEDIRAEVLRDHERGRQSAMQVPSTSRERLQDVMHDLSLSQVDQSFLDALPDDIKNEVVADLQNKKVPQPPIMSSNKSTTTHSPSKMQIGLKSPAKNRMSPRKKCRDSPKKSKPLERGQQKINLIPIRPSSPAELPVKCIITEEAAQPEALSDEEEDSSLLNAHTPLEDSMQLLREWVDSTQTPQPVDRDFIGNFLAQLVRNQRIDKVDLLLRTLHRKIECEKEKHLTWESCFYQIVDMIQSAMLQEYGAELQVPQGFHYN